MDRVAPEHRNALTASIAYSLRRTRKAGVFYMQEIWKDIVGYEGLYQVSSLGNIRSLSFGARNYRKSNIVKLLKQSPTNCGYFKVQLYCEGKSKMMYVHRIVATAFIPNPERKPQVNHIDGNKSNNVASNLEWVSQSENHIHAIAHGLRSPSPMLGRTGADNPNSKVILQYDLLGNFINEWCGIAEAARNINASAKLISNCVCGNKKSACGYIWRAKESDDYPLKIKPLARRTSRGIERHGTPRPRAMRRIRQLSKDGNLIRVWNNYIELTSETGYDNGNIYKAINGKLKTAYGFKWEYE